VNAVEDSRSNGVPDILPVDASNVKPAGKAGDMVYEYCPNPPTAVTGTTSTAISLNNISGDASRVVVNAGGGLSDMVRENVLALVWLASSVAVTVNAVVANSSVAVPEISPIDVTNVNPTGRFGDMLNVLVPNPPVADTGRNGVTDWYWVRFTDGVLTVVINAGGMTSRSKFFELVVWSWSTTVIVKVVRDSRTAGLPEISPELALMLTPVGSDGLMEYSRSPFPPEPDTGSLGTTMFWFNVSDISDWSTVVTSGGGSSILRLKVLLVVFALASVMVISNGDSTSVTEGVPVIAPETADNDNPEGSAGDTEYA